MFLKAAPLFQEAIEKSGYSYKLKYEPPNNNPRPKKRGRKRHILWFNPPFNSTVRTNVAREFLTLIDQCFPPGNPLKKIFNRNTVKVAYSTTPNMNTSLVCLLLSIKCGLNNTNLKQLNTSIDNNIFR